MRTLLLIALVLVGCSVEAVTPEPQIIEIDVQQPEPQPELCYKPFATYDAQDARSVHNS